MRSGRSPHKEALQVPLGDLASSDWLDSYTKKTISILGTTFTEYFNLPLWFVVYGTRNPEHSEYSSEEEGSKSHRAGLVLHVYSYRTLTEGKSCRHSNLFHCPSAPYTIKSSRARAVTYSSFSPGPRKMSGENRTKCPRQTEQHRQIEQIATCRKCSP